MYKRISFKNFFPLIFTLWYSTEIIFNTTMNMVMGVSIKTISSAVDWLILVFLMIEIVLFQVYKKRELMIIIGITLPVVAATVLSGNKSILSLWMFVVAAKNSDLDKIIHIAYKILLLMIPLVIVLCLLGVIEDKTLFRDNTQRFSLGFSHPNQLGLRCFQLTLCHFYVHRKKLKLNNYIVIFGMILFIIMVPNSQTACISIFVFLLLILIDKYIQNQKKILQKIYTTSLLAGAFLLNVLSLILSYIDVNQNFVLAKINSWMSSRFSVCHRVWMIYGVSLFGQRVYVTEAERKLVGIKSALWLDNAYVSILLRYGVLVFLFFSFFYIYLLAKMIQRREFILAIILFVYAVYGIMETGLYMLAHNIFLISFAEILYSKGAGNHINENSNK